LNQARFSCQIHLNRCEHASTPPCFATSLTNFVKSSERKIRKYAFSGGQETLAEQRRLGGDPDVDVAYQYLSFFENNDAKLQTIRAAYCSGDLLTGELKTKCVQKLQAYVSAFQTRRAAIDDDVLDTFMKVRPLEWGSKATKDDDNSVD
jgi:tryptophanyl-tRNA synthetase